MKSLFFFSLFLININLDAQIIKIVNVKKYGDDYDGYLIIKCLLMNNTNKEIVLPKQIDKNYNYFSFFYRIETSPKHIFSYLKHPPLPLNTIYPKLTKENLLICAKNSNTNFEIDTRKIGDMGLYLSNNMSVENYIKLKKIRILYTPYEVEEKKLFLEKEIEDIQFYDKRIISNYYKFPKKRK